MITWTTIREKTSDWVDTLNEYPRDMIDRLMRLAPRKWKEITMPHAGDRVYITDGENVGETGEIIKDRCNDNPRWHLITFDNEYLDDIVLTEDILEIQRDSMLPMSGMWSFSSLLDNLWLEKEESVRIMSELGFRIFRHEQWGYFFGIDGLSYNFHDAHWVPLFKECRKQYVESELRDN